jgi:glycine cleavage system H protein
MHLAASAAGNANADGRPPPARFYLTEPARGLARLAVLPLAAPWLAAAPRGDGHGVLVLPGLLASDMSTALLRQFLRRLGYHVHGWDLGRNVGPTDAVLDGLPRALARLADRTGLHYTREHEWVAVEGSTATVGITDHAQQALGDVVYVSAPAPGSKVTAGEPCGEVESTKSVSDIFAPVDGEVLEANAELGENPGVVNSDPYGAGWLFKVNLPGADGELPPGLITAAEYEELIASEE